MAKTIYIDWGNGDIDYFICHDYPEEPTRILCLNLLRRLLREKPDNNAIKLLQHYYDKHFLEEIVKKTRVDEANPIPSKIISNRSKVPQSTPSIGLISTGNSNIYSKTALSSPTSSTTKYSVGSKRKNTMTMTPTPSPNKNNTIENKLSTPSPQQPALSSPSSLTTHVQQPASTTTNIYRKLNEIDVTTGDQVLGRGASGLIHRGTIDTSSGKVDCAVKLFFGPRKRSNFETEMGIVELIQPHPNIIKSYGYNLSDYNPMIIYELCDSTLSPLKLLTNLQGVKVIKGTANGISHLHYQKPPILHRDIKFANIYVNGNGGVRIGDFGHSQVYDQNKEIYHAVGSFGFTAPEAIFFTGSVCVRNISLKSDVFSFAIICYCIFEKKKKPFKNERKKNGFEETLKNIKEGYRPTFSDKTPMVFQKLISRCWDNDPANRPSFRSIIRILKQVKVDENDLVS